MLTRSRTRSGTWEPVVNLTPANDVRFYSLALAVDPAGMAHLAWVQNWRIWVADEERPPAA